MYVFFSHLANKGLNAWQKAVHTNQLHTGVLDREGNARKVVNCSCVVVKDWGEESQERSVIMNYFQSAE